MLLGFCGPSCGPSRSPANCYNPAPRVTYTKYPITRYRRPVASGRISLASNTTRPASTGSSRRTTFPGSAPPNSPRSYFSSRAGTTAQNYPDLDLRPQSSPSIPSNYYDRLAKRKREAERKHSAFVNRDRTYTRTSNVNLNEGHTVNAQNDRDAQGHEARKEFLRKSELGEDGVADPASSGRKGPRGFFGKHKDQGPR